jgi:hypothetical protein
MGNLQKVYVLMHANQQSAKIGGREIRAIRTRRVRYTRKSPYRRPYALVHWAPRGLLDSQKAEH